MTCIAIDDEPLALDLLESNIRMIPDLRLLARCANAMEAGLLLQQHPVDLLFLDIQMPGVSGIQFLQGFSRTPPMAIFVTAYEKYAIEGYGLDVIDYLLKPVSFVRFMKAVNKASDKLRSRTPVVQPSTADYFFVNSEYNLVRIDFHDIAYVEGLKDYVKIFLLSSARPVLTRMSMKSLEDKLPAGQFVRVHKSFIVSLGKIQSIRKGRISVLKAIIPISEHFKANLYRFIDGPGAG